MRPDARTPRRYAVLAPGLFATHAAKTAHGAISYGPDVTVAVIDPSAAGRRARDVVPHLRGDAPIVATLADALAFAPTALLIGVAPPGGALPAAWRATIVEAIGRDLEIVSGLHEFLGADAEIAAAAASRGVRLTDLRTPPAPRLFSGDGNAVRAVVLLTVGSDCGAGKMTASLELARAARTAGLDARFLATGQTGILIAGDGVPADRTISDFTSGAIEGAVIERGAADLIVVEGQGAINHPAFATVTLGLLYGACADALVLVHRVAGTHLDGFGTPILPVPRLIDLYEKLCAAVKPAPVIGVSLTTQGLDEPAARDAIAWTARETGLPCDDVVRFGPEAFYCAIAPRLRVKTEALR